MTESLTLNLACFMLHGVAHLLIPMPDGLGPGMILLEELLRTMRNLEASCEASMIQAAFVGGGKTVILGITPDDYQELLEFLGSEEARITLLEMDDIETLGYPHIVVDAELETSEQLYAVVSRVFDHLERDGVMPEQALGIRLDRWTVNFDGGVLGPSGRMKA